MIYRPIEQSWWERNKPDFCDDFMTLSTKSKICCSLMSVVLIGGGIAGCIIAASGGIRTGGYQQDPIGELT